MNFFGKRTKEDCRRELLLKLAVTDALDDMVRELRVADPVEVVNLSLAALGWVIEKKRQNKYIVAQDLEPTNGEDELVVPQMMATTPV